MSLPELWRYKNHSPSRAEQVELPVPFDELLRVPYSMGVWGLIPDLLQSLILPLSLYITEALASLNLTSLLVGIRAYTGKRY